MKKLFLTFLKEEDGATIMEYVAMLAFVAGIVLVAFPSLRKSITGWMTGMFSDMNGGMTGETLEYVCPDGSTTDDLSTC